jgi:hypothetical protein
MVKKKKLVCLMFRKWESFFWFCFFSFVEKESWERMWICWMKERERDEANAIAIEILVFEG